MAQKILVFGNPFLDFDNLPLRLLPRLREKFPEIQFVEFDTAEDLEKEGPELAIIDAVQGIKKIEILTEKDLEKIGNSKTISMHDFDLGLNLKLLKKLGKVKKILIFGIPVGMDEEKAFEGLCGKIQKNCSAP